jgi:hypothetical protein
MGLIACKILDGPAAKRVHSAGLDVALSRREVLLGSSASVAQKSEVKALLASPAAARKRGRGKRWSDAKTVSEWRDMLTQTGSEELRKIMQDMAKETDREGEAEAERAPSPEPSHPALPQWTPGDRVDVVFPYRRLEGVARVDGRFNVTAEIIAPSSLCFIVDKHTFLDVAKGFHEQMSSVSEATSHLRTPFLQVVDLSLRLRRDAGRRSAYLPTNKGVIRSRPEGTVLKSKRSALGPLRGSNRAHALWIRPMECRR